MSVRVLVVDDHSLVADALAAALATVDGVELSGVASTPAEAVTLLAARRPDVALVDLRLGTASALDHLAAMRSASPATGLLVLTGWPSAQGVEAALAGGARGLLSKARALDELVDAVRRVHAGELVVEPALLGALVRQATQPPSSRPEPRELEVLALLADARSTGEIARALHVSEHTVKNRIRDCMAKLDAHSRTAAVREATRRGWIVPSLPG